MRAAQGAIEACTLDADTLKPTLTVIGGGAPRGICGSGIIDIVAELFRTGAVNARGMFARNNPRILRDPHGIARYVLYSADDENFEISVSEVDISGFVHAKAAIYSALEIMLESVGEDAAAISGVYIAGGIGGGVSIDNAVHIGMLPDLPRELFSYIGNAALTGACAALISDTAREKLREIGSGMTYLELSSMPGYMERFVAACFLPHTNRDLFPNA